MKKVFLILSSLLLLSSCSSTSQVEEETKESTLLKDTFKKLNKSSTYSIFSTSKIKGVLNGVTYEDGWYVNRNVSSKATEIYVGNNNDYSLISSVGYCLINEGIMKYSYLENGDIKPSYLQSESKDLLSSSFALSLPLLEEFVLPTSLKYGDTYNFNLGLKRDVKIVDQFLNTVFYSYEELKDNIKSALVKVENEGKSLHFICQVNKSEDEGIIDVEIYNINEDKTPLTIKEYIENGGSYLPFSDELLGIKETLSSFSPYFYEYDNENYGLLRFTIGSNYRALTFLENESEYNQYLVKISGINNVRDNIYCIYEHEGRYFSYSYLGYREIDPTSTTFKDAMYEAQIFDNTITSDQLDYALDLVAFSYFGIFDIYSLDLASSLAIYSETKEQVFSLIDDVYTTTDKTLLDKLNEKLGLTKDDAMVCFGINYVPSSITICFYNSSNRGNFLTFNGFDESYDIKEVNSFLNLIEGE